jgi:RNA polymerase sigma-70 factor, ECF subfamily
MVIEHERTGTPQNNIPNQFLEELFVKYSDRIYQLALGMVSDPIRAEDIVQETFLKAMLHKDQFEGRSSMSTWLYRIAYNTALDLLRKRTEVPLPEEEPGSDDSAPASLPQALVDWDSSPEKILEGKQTRSQLEIGIQKLTPALRAVFLLRDVQEVPTTETAEILGLSENVVKVRLHRARLELREYLTCCWQKGLLTS